jgi:hypothetical protein
LAPEQQGAVIFTECKYFITNVHPRQTFESLNAFASKELALLTISFAANRSQ